ncbi:unnamed protein product [Peniophora sp. CBMAI 1063]|nr:unnamed protein product [Peniophora sp. CBMAI 1063]
MSRFASFVLPVGLLWLSLYDVVYSLALPEDVSAAPRQGKREVNAPSRAGSADTIPMPLIASLFESVNKPNDPNPELNIEAVQMNHDTRASLDLNSRASSDNPSIEDTGPTHSPGRAITGGVVGGLGLIALIALVHFIWRRRRQRRASEKLAELLAPRRGTGGLRASVLTQAEPPIATPARVRKSAGFAPSFEIRTPHGVIPSRTASFPPNGLQVATHDVHTDEPIRALRHPTEVR